MHSHIISVYDGAERDTGLACDVMFKHTHTQAGVSWLLLLLHRFLVCCSLLGRAAPLWRHPLQHSRCKASWRLLKAAELSAM